MQQHSLAGGSGRKRQTPGGSSKHHALFSGKKSRRSGEQQGSAAMIDFDPMDEDEEQVPPEQPWAQLQRLFVEFSEEAEGAGEDDGELAVLLHQFTGPMRLEVARLQPMELLCQVPADLVAKAFALMSRSVAATSKRMAASRWNPLPYITKRKIDVTSKNMQRTNVGGRSPGIKICDTMMG